MRGATSRGGSDTRCCEGKRGGGEGKGGGPGPLRCHAAEWPDVSLYFASHSDSVSRYFLSFFFADSIYYHDDTVGISIATKLKS